MAIREARLRQNSPPDQKYCQDRDDDPLAPPHRQRDAGRKGGAGKNLEVRVHDRDATQHGRGEQCDPHERKRVQRPIHHKFAAQEARRTEVSVSGNRHHLGQVLNNLLDNAIKFGQAKEGDEDSGDPPRRTIVVELTRVPESQAAQLIVRDHGVGIGTEELPRLFNRFYRADAARSRSAGGGGTGLGLSICRAIVESHHGQIRLDSQPGQGTAVTILLPAAP